MHQNTTNEALFGLERCGCIGIGVVVSGGSGMLESVPLYERRHMCIEGGTVLSTPVLSKRFRGGVKYDVPVNGQPWYIAA